jgi:hypothetical protein
MGGEIFNTTESGDTATEAFTKARDQARYDYGHAGYTGTIAEKEEFVVCECPKGMSVGIFVRLLEAGGGTTAMDMLSDDQAEVVRAAMKVFDDKWGPAVCVPHPDEPDKFTFCGIASS